MNNSTAGINKQQQKYYSKEWQALELSNQPGRSGWRTSVPAPDFMDFARKSQFAWRFCYTQTMATQPFQDAINDIKKTVKRFEKIEGKPWGVEGAVIELAKQVGQLSALVMNREGYYFPDREKLSASYAATDDKIADELVDIMFAVVRIADHYGIDLVSINIETRKKEDEFLKTKGV